MSADCGPSKPSLCGASGTDLHTIRQLLLREPVIRLEGRNRSKANVLVYDAGGFRVAIKTYAEQPAWLRHTLGRWMTRREAAAYIRSGRGAGLPDFLGRVDAWTLALEWVEGRALPKFGGLTAGVRERIFDEIETIIEGLHRRGVALGDLHHRNVLVTPQGHAVVIDLAMAWTVDSRRRGPQAWIFRKLAELDRLALVRMRARSMGGDPAEAVARYGGSIAAWYRWGRRIKHLVGLLRRKR
jgi:hypothetical protein